MDNAFFFMVKEDGIMWQWFFGKGKHGSWQTQWRWQLATKTNHANSGCTF